MCNISPIDVAKKYGPTTALLFLRALEGELRYLDLEMARYSEEENDIINPIKRWNPDNINGAAEWLIKDIEEEFEEQ